MDCVLCNRSECIGRLVLHDNDVAFVRRALWGGATDTGLGALFDVTCSFSLHSGFDEPEHSIAQTPKPVRWVLKSDNVREEISMFEPQTYNRYDPGVLLVHL